MAAHEGERRESEKANHRTEEDGSSNLGSEISRDVEQGDALPPNEEKITPRASLELTRTVSTALSRVTTRMTNRHIVDPGPPPGTELTICKDGGVKAWTQVAMGWIVIVTTWGYLNSFGVFQTYYTSELAIDQSTVSWIGSIQLWLIFIISTFSGRALDAGLFIPTFILGSFFQVLGIFMNSLCKEFWQILLAQGLCTGIGSGILFTPSLGLITTYFSKKRGLAVAIVTTGNSLGGAIYPVIVRQLLPKIGFAWTVRVIGFMNLACLCIGLAFMRPRLPPRKTGPLVEWRAFTEVPYALAVVGMTLVFGGLFFVYYYITSYAFDILGMSYASSANILILFNAIGIPARLFTGIIADRLTGPLNAIILLIAINALCAFTWLAVRSVAGMYVETAIYGIAAGAFQCLFPTTITSLHDDVSKNGIRMGMAFSVFSFAGLLGPPVGGQLLETNGGGRGGYVSALVGVGVATAVGTGLLCVARVKKVGWGLGTKC
ncbi:uncharacterized protein LTR77_002955 [Saxophila tyrrhenica]|uniref:Major facilitator superfamily (MFS) profile domain-containing protein n=1 Tax=Saxophila tyrrhenica TaxID=1690608 RepID=A0AAV9PJP8_9PEZI|nr:hypothetical protein LTR77_002955 [Saxophila tyrrhenica]